MKRTPIIALLAAGMALAIAAPTSANPPTMQDRIDYVIATHPGGVQIDWNEVAWENGDVTLTLSTEETSASRAAVGSCASANYCIYSGSNMLGSRVTFSSCGPHRVNMLGAPVRSIANARSSGSVQAKNGSTVVKTVSAGAYSNLTATTTTIGC